MASVSDRNNGAGISPTCPAPSTSNVVSGSPSDTAASATSVNSTPQHRKTSKNPLSNGLSPHDECKGFEVDLFLNRQSAQPYLCSICFNVVYNCHETSCGHIFCGPCIKQAVSADEKSRCPIDRKSNIELYPSLFINRRVMNLQVRCPNHGSGCEWVGALKDLIPRNQVDNPPSPGEHPQGHYAVCGFAMVMCEKCGISVPRKDLQSHLVNCATTCPCSKHISSMAHRLNHLQTCPLAQIECSDGCKMRLKREDLQRHLEFECSERTVSCPYHNVGCTQRIKLKYVEQHLKYNSTTHYQMKVDHIMEQVEQNKLQMELFKNQITALQTQNELLTKQNEQLVKEQESRSSNVSNAPEVLITRGSNQWEETGIFIRRSKIHHGRVCYTKLHGPCAIRWHPGLVAWLIDRRGLKKDNEASLIAFGDVPHPGLVTGPWSVYNPDCKKWLNTESYHIAPCSVAELFFKVQSVCPEYSALAGSPPIQQTTNANYKNSHLFHPGVLGQLPPTQMSLTCMTEEPEIIFDRKYQSLEAPQMELQHHLQPPGLVQNKENEDEINRNKKGKKWRKLTMSYGP